MLNLIIYISGNLFCFYYVARGNYMTVIINFMNNFKKLEHYLEIQT